MENLLKIIKELQATSGKKAKQEIIKANLDNDLFCKTMQFLLNDFITTGISSKKMKKVLKDLNVAEVDVPKNLAEAMQYVTKNNTGSDYNITCIRLFIHDVSKNNLESKLIEEILMKSLKIGISADTWNKCTSDHMQIPVFDVMLAKKYQDHEKKVNGDFILTTKLDGSRCVYLDGKFYSRSGQEIDGLDDILDEIVNLNKDYVYDGELILSNPNNLPSDELFRLSQKETRKKGRKRNLEFHIFDMVNKVDFMKGKDTTTCIQRKKMLYEQFANHYIEFKWLKDVPVLYIGNDKLKIDEFLKRALENKEEGLMLNIADSPYECKRSDKILKIKVMDTCDLRITGFEEGDGKYKGTLGRVNVDYKGFTVGVGSGFSDSEREEIWNNQDKYLGRVIEISNFGESTNQQGSTSLRFPIFKRVREEGKEVSYN